MLNLLRDKQRKMFIKTVAIFISFIFLFESAGYSFVDISNNSAALRPPIIFSKWGQRRNEFKNVAGPDMETPGSITGMRDIIRTTNAETPSELLEWTILIEEFIVQKCAQDPAVFGNYIMSVINKANSILQKDLLKNLKTYGLIAPETGDNRPLMLNDLVPAFRNMASWIQTLRGPGDITSGEQFGKVVYSWILLFRAMELVEEIKDDKALAELLRLTHKIEQTIMWIQAAGGDVWVGIGDMDQLSRLNRLYGHSLLGFSTRGPIGEIFSIVDRTVADNKGFSYKYKAGDEFAFFSRQGASADDMRVMLEDIRYQVEGLGLKYGAAIITNLSQKAKAWIQEHGGGAWHPHWIHWEGNG